MQWGAEDLEEEAASGPPRRSLTLWNPNPHTLGVQGERGEKAGVTGQGIVGLCSLLHVRGAHM